jgi:predicted negative regulator of RcsB-dependent stress response
MRHVLLSLGLASVIAAPGCASPQKIRATARDHERRAAMYEARGDHYRAARERDAAIKQYRKAANRDYNYFYY